MNDRLPLEVTNWWMQWLPLGSALVVAAIALVGVILSNRAADKRGKQDRADAQQRDFVQWQRETLLHLGTEALDASIHASDNYRKIAYSQVSVADDHFEPVRQARSQIQSVWASFRLLNAKDAAEKCTQLRDAVGGRNILRATRDLNAAENPTERRAAVAQFEEALIPLSAAQGEFTAALRVELWKLRPVEP